MTRSLKWGLIVGVLMVFAAGIATGMFLGARKAHDVMTSRHEGRMGEHMRERLTRRLQLTPEQLEKVAPIIDETGKRLHEIRVESGRRVAETMRESHTAMAPHLTAEQRDKLERMKMRHKRMRRGRGMPPSGDGPDER